MPVKTKRSRAALGTLTPREVEILPYLVSGRLNKQIAADLGVVEKTVKVHRMHVMQKLGLHSLAELVRLVERHAHRTRRRWAKGQLSRVPHPPSVHGCRTTPP